MSSRGGRRLQAMTTTAAPVTHTLDVPGVTLTYDVRGDVTGVPLFLIGSPMSAAGFPTLASYFPDRCVITYDPRGVERSVRTDDQRESNPRQHAEDLHAIIEAVGAGPVDLFASSGGAINALALVAAHPGDVRTLVAHEPPLVQALPDREAAVAALQDLKATYLAKGFHHGMAKFIALVSHQGEYTGAYGDVDPAQFGMPDTDDGTRDDPLMFQNADGVYSFVPDFEALKAAPTEIVIGIGEESGETMTARAPRGVAAALGIEPTIFPSGHAGFLGGEFGQTGDPERFGPFLRGILG
jgi:pimeloyl-ACP methyl ester carboxylesterase